MTMVTISAEDPRSIKAIEIAAGAGQWLKCQTRDGQKAYGIPSQCRPGRYYLVTCSSCDCQDFRRHGLSDSRLGMAGNHRPCKHVLACRLYCELVKAQQARPTPRKRRGHLQAHPPLPIHPAHPEPVEGRPVATLEYRCLLCARDAVPGQQQCQVCGGSLIAEEVISPVANR